jgi:dienelactone hydrolase
MRLGLAVAIVVAAVGAAPAASSTRHPFPHMPAECKRADFRSGGTTVRAALCRPAKTDPAPAVVVLHGCGGFDTLDHRIAVDLPKAGIATLYVDYFDPTPPPGRFGFCNAPGGFENAFPVWQQEVLDATASLRRYAGIDPRRIGLVGWSLGGGLAVGTAASGRGSFSALVGFSTGFFGGGGGAGDLRDLPPTLLLSGGDKDAIPLSATRDLYDLIRSSGVPASLYVYRNGSHRWPGRQGTAGIDATERFLHRVLA